MGLNLQSTSFQSLYLPQRLPLPPRKHWLEIREAGRDRKRFVILTKHRQPNWHSLVALLKRLKVEFKLEERFGHNILSPSGKHHTIGQNHLLTPGQEVSVGVPSCLNIRNSSSISESPGKSGCRFTCDKLAELKNAQFIYVSRRYHLHKNTAQTPCVYCSSVKLGAKKDLWCPVMR